MHIEFTQANDSHVPAIVALVNSAYRGESSRQGWTTEADFLDGQRIDTQGVKELLSRANSVILIAEDDETDELLGCVHVENINDSAYVGMVTVSPLTQGQGIGGELLEEAEALAQFWNCKEISMTVLSERKELIKWYQKKGFHLTGETKPFPMKDSRFGIPKVEHLEFVILIKTL